jgi:Cell wall-active antibiotics response 4TMS YvqF/Domain of unknown function (DUF5668)
MAHSSGPIRVTPQVILGVGIVIFGLALTADNAGWADAQDILRFWPLAIVAVGLAKFLGSSSRSSRLFAGIVTVVGAAMTAEQVFNVRIRVWDWWPLAIVAMGLVIISKAFGGGPKRPQRPRAGEVTSSDPFYGTPLGVPSTGDMTGADTTSSPGAAPSSEAPPSPGAVPLRSTTSDADISEFAMWSGTQRRVASSNFRRGDLTAIMGGIEVDLRQASTAGGEAVIDVFALWGGIEIRVPPDWNVSNRVTAIMGGAEDSSTGTQAAKHRLVVRGFAIMGGVEIKT